MLAQEFYAGTDIARRLGVWHQAVYKSLKGLRRKGLVEPWTTLGENLAGSKLFRRFYTLNSEKVAIAVPVPSPTKVQLQHAKEKAQSDAIQREKENIRLQRVASLKPSTRLKALIGQVRQEAL